MWCMICLAPAEIQIIKLVNLKPYQNSLDKVAYDQMLRISNSHLMGQVQQMFPCLIENMLDQKNLL